MLLRFSVTRVQSEEEGGEGGGEDEQKLGTMPIPIY